MKTNSKGLELIKKFEGCRLKSYKALPTEKYFTIGWGHYGIDVKENQVISQEEADALLVSDLTRYEKYVETYAGHLNLNENQFSALVSFTYNCGPGNLKKLVADRTSVQVADALLNFNHAGGKELAGLTRRRTAERELYLMKNQKVIIGSARIDEQGHIVGGKDGDQKQTTTDDFTGEVSLQNYYEHKKGWVGYRHKDPSKRVKIGAAMAIACNNPCIGYNQNERLDVVKNGVETSTPSNCDCSSLIRACIIAAGAKDPGNFNTSTEGKKLEATGEYDKFDPSVSKMEIGDILVTKTKGHTVAVTGVDDAIVRPTLRKGAKGESVKELQNLLKKKGFNLQADGDFGPITEDCVKEYQKSKKLEVDGIVGKNTWNSLLS